MARENPSEHAGPALPPSAIALRQGRSSLAGKARAGDLQGYPAAAAGLMDAYFRERLAELAHEPGFPADSPPFALVAVGGYGRAELCPASDVDVLVLYAEAVPKSAEELSRGLFHPLWDLGLDLGHGVRSLRDGLALAREDTQVLTSLLDIRLIAASGPDGARVLERFQREFSEKVHARAAEPFGQWVLAHNATRRAEYGDSSGLLEPELKNGLGALRDVHQIRWLMGLRPGAAWPFTPGDLEVLEEDYAFVLAARTALHLAAGRKTDRLSFDLQPQVARALGFAGAEPGEDVSSSEASAALATGLAVEAFLSRLHQSMTRIRSMRQACWLEAFPPVAHAPALPPGTPAGIADTPTGVAFAAETPESAPPPDPGLVLALYAAAARAARPVAWSALRATRGALARPGARAAFAALPGTLAALTAIFRASGRDAESSPLSLISGKPKPSGLVRALKDFFAPGKAPGSEPEPLPPDAGPALSTALQSMLDTGLLAALVPEFGPVEHLVQFDDFHIHPVGKHTLEVVRALAALPESDQNGGDPRLAASAKALPHYDRLLLAGFCHDLAKPDRDHEGAGARLAETVLRRLGADEDAIADVAFLVREHLLIPKTATRRDLADESVAARVAEICATPARLDMLHLLAVADSSSTGPRAWNPWTASLFSELALKARHLLTSGPLAEPRAVEKSRQVREAALNLAAQASPPLTREYAEQCLERMPARAALVLDAPTLVRHMDLARRFRASLDEDRVRKPSGKAGIGVVEIDAVPLPGTRAFQVSLAALDQPGLFAVMAGVLALHDLNILSAEVLTWTGGAAGSGGGNMALDLFVVQEPAEGLYLEDLWQRIRRAVGYALTGKLSLEYRLEQKRTSPLTLPSRAPKARRKVRVDNAESDFYTVVEIAAPDRLGLLHDLARALAGQHLEIHLARIATSVGRIHDVFYVRDEGGQKLGDPAQAEALKKALLHAAR